MGFVTKYSKTSEYPETEGLCKDIAGQLLEKEKTIEDYTRELGVSLNNTIPVPEFIANVASPYNIEKKDAYYLYYTLKEDPKKDLKARTLIEKVEEYRNELVREKEELFGGNQNEESKSHESIEVKKEIKKEVKKTVKKDESKGGSKIGSKFPVRPNRPLPVAVVELYNLLFAPTAKRRMNERMVFKILDTDGNGMLTRQEFLKGITKLRIKFTPEQVDEIFDFADINQEGNVCTEEFLGMIQLARERIAAQETNKLTEAYGKTPEEMYNDALAKIKSFAISSKDVILNYDYKVQYKEDLESAVVPTAILEASLRDLHIGLSEQEIKLVSHMADQNKDQMLDEEEFKGYLESIDIHQLPPAFQSVNVPKPEKPIEKGPTPELIKSIELLKSHTNFGKIADPNISTQMLAQVIETPYPHFELIPEKHFAKVDSTGKYKMTIVKSRKAAILW